MTEILWLPLVFLCFMPTGDCEVFHRDPVKYEYICESNREELIYNIGLRIDEDRRNLYLLRSACVKIEINTEPGRDA